MLMKLEISIDGKYAFIILGTLLVVGASSAYAYNQNFNSPSSSAPSFGHSADEMNVMIGGQAITLQKLIEDGNITINRVPPSPHVPASLSCTIRTGGYSASCLPGEILTGGICHGGDDCNGQDSSAYGGSLSGNMLSCINLGGCTPTTSYAVCCSFSG